MMVGRELTQYYTRDFMQPGKVVLSCKNISDGKMVKDAVLTLEKVKS